jgi:hypothetical protein
MVGARRRGIGDIELSNRDDIAMRNRITQALLALTVVLGLGASMSQPAEAHRRGGIAAGLAVGTLLGLGIAGAYAGPRYYYGAAPGCYRGPRQCGWAGRRCWINRLGEDVCRGGEWRCWRPTICD